MALSQGRMESEFSHTPQALKKPTDVNTSRLDQIATAN